MKRDIYPIIKTKKKKEAFPIISFIITIFWIAALFFPVYWLMVSSTKDPIEANKNPPSFSIVLPNDFTTYIDTTGLETYDEDDFIYEAIVVNWMVADKSININMNSISTAWVKDNKIIAKGTLKYLTFHERNSDFFFGSVNQSTITRWRDNNDQRYQDIVQLMKEDYYASNLNEKMPSKFASDEYSSRLSTFLVDSMDAKATDPESYQFIKLQGKFSPSITTKKNFWGMFNNYSRAWKQEDSEGKEFTFMKYMFNSCILAVGAILLQFIFSASVAYGLTLISKRASRAITLFFLITIMIPGIVTQIPLYCLLMNLNLSDSYLAILIPGAVSATNIVLFKAFFDNVPREMREAAKIDGASEFAIYTRFIIPLSIPVFMAIALTTFIGSWNNFFWPNMVLTSESKFTFPLIIQRALSNDSGGGLRNYSLSLAMSVIASIPTLFLFAFCQKQMKEGMLLGGIKG